MSEIDPEMALHIDIGYRRLDTHPKASHPAIVDKALGCFLLGAEMDDEEYLEAAVPGILYEDLTEDDIFDIPYSRYTTPEYPIGQDRSVLFDQFFATEDKLGQLRWNAMNGFFSMLVVRDSGIHEAQYIFAHDVSEDQDPLFSSVYAGYNCEPDNFLTDKKHLRSLSSFLDDLQRIIIAEKMRDFIEFPTVEIDASKL